MSQNSLPIQGAERPSGTFNPRGGGHFDGAETRAWRQASGDTDPPETLGLQETSAYAFEGDPADSDADAPAEIERIGLINDLINSDGFKTLNDQLKSKVLDIIGSSGEPSPSAQPASHSGEAGQPPEAVQPPVQNETPGQERQNPQKARGAEDADPAQPTESPTPPAYTSPPAGQHASERNDFLRRIMELINSDAFKQLPDELKSKILNALGAGGDGQQGDGGQNGAADPNALIGQLDELINSEEFGAMDDAAKAQAIDELIAGQAGTPGENPETTGEQAGIETASTGEEQPPIEADAPPDGEPVVNEDDGAASPESQRIELMNELINSEGFQALSDPLKAQVLNIIAGGSSTGENSPGEEIQSRVLPAAQVEA